MSSLKSAVLKLVRHRAALFVTAATLIAAPLAVPAAEIPPCSPGYMVAHINGVGVASRLVALETILDLNQRFGSTWKSRPLRYKLLYNPSYGLVDDVREAFSQKYQNEPELARRTDLILAALNPEMELSGSVDQSVLSAIREIVYASIVKYIESSIAKVGTADFVGLSESFASSFRALFAADWKVLAIAHSQGNLFLKRAVESARVRAARSSVEFVHIAPPTLDLGGEYILNDRDIIIQLVSSTVGSTPQANAILPIEHLLKDISGHGMSETYLDPALVGDSQPFAKARAAVSGALDALIEPCSVTVVEGSGACTTQRQLIENSAGDILAYRWIKSASLTVTSEFAGETLDVGEVLMDDAATPITPSGSPDAVVINAPAPAETLNCGTWNNIGAIFSSGASCQAPTAGLTTTITYRRDNYPVTAYQLNGQWIQCPNFGESRCNYLYFPPDPVTAWYSENVAAIPFYSPYFQLVAQRSLLTGNEVRRVYATAPISCAQP